MVVVWFNSQASLPSFLSFPSLESISRKMTREKKKKNNVSSLSKFFLPLVKPPHTQKKQTRKQKYTITNHTKKQISNQKKIKGKKRKTKKKERRQCIVTFLIFSYTILLFPSLPVETGLIFCESEIDPLL